MHLQNHTQFTSTPVFVPKTMQKHQTQSTLISNRTKFGKQTSLNAPALSNGFIPRRKSSISPFNKLSHSIPVKAQVHQTLDSRETNGSVTGTVDQVKHKTKMTAIKSILKSKQTDNIPNGIIKTIQLETTNGQTLSNKSKCEEDIDNQNIRRKSSIVQFDIQTVKDNSKVQLSTIPHVISSPPTTLSSSRLSIGRQSIFSNQTIPNDLPKASQRMSDLRKILNPEIEKEDSLKKLGDAIIHCECFELNLNNAAKIITVLVLLATFILVIQSLIKGL